MEKEKLSDGWKILSIEKCISNQLSGFACAMSKLVENNGYVQLRPFNIEDGNLNLSELYQVPLDMVDKNKYFLEKGDILFNNTNSTELVGKSAIIDKDYSFAFSNHINRIRVNPNVILPEYFHSYLRFMWARGHFARHCKKWIGQSGYTLNKLKEQMILVPSIETQKEIVDKLNKQMIQIDVLKKEAKNGIDNIAELFQSHLKYMFETELSQKFPDIKLKNLTSKIGSGLTPRGGQSVYQNEGVPLIRSMNVHLNQFKNEGLAHISEEINESMKNTRVIENDVLLNITGASIGRVCVVPKAICPANVNQHVSIIRTNDELNAYYLSYYISNPNFQKYVMDLESGATRQALTKTKIENFNIPLPSLEIQKEIVNRLNEIKKNTQEMVNQMNDQLNAINQLPESILNEVFEKYELPDEA